MTLHAVGCLLCVLVLGLIGTAQGPSGPALPDASLYTCRWASTPPKIDGLADEPCWEHAATISNFRASWLDDCFELFLKPSKDRSGYYEFHVTPANTQMDLFIPKRVSKAYAIYKSADAFDFQNAVHVDGTLEDRTDMDRSWQVEFKIAWKDFHRTGGGPRPGDSWSYSLCRYD